MKYFAALLVLLLVHTVCAVDIASGAASVFGDATSAIGGAASTAASGVSRGGAAVPVSYTHLTLPTTPYV